MQTHTHQGYAHRAHFADDGVTEFYKLGLHFWRDCTIYGENTHQSGILVQ